MNRLKLDFSLETDIERNNFVKSYLPTLKNPTPEELETISNYLLWGKSAKESYKSPRDQLIKTGIIPPSKSSDWTTETESLDALFESPTFDETSLLPLTAPRIVVSKKKFSREDALKNAPSYLRKTFENLFHEIDTTDLEVALYEREKRGKKEVREELLKRFKQDEIDTAIARVQQWNGHTYLKKRHLLIQLRSDQYDLRDLYKRNVGSSSNYLVSFFDSTLGLESGIEVLPLGLETKSNQLVFADVLAPSNFSPTELEKISTDLWSKKNYRPGTNSFYFDFRNPDHVYTLFLLEKELRLEGEDEDINESLGALFKTLEFYIQFAKLSESQREILRLKRARKENYDIALEVNKQFNKKYAPNYISTIFKQRIIKKICEGAELHLKVVENLFFEEEFKKCTCCGRTLLIDEAFFTRKKKSKDGFTNRCKECEKEKRNRGGDD